MPLFPLTPVTPYDNAGRNYYCLLHYRFLHQWANGCIIELFLRLMRKFVTALINIFVALILSCLVCFCVRKLSVKIKYWYCYFYHKSSRPSVSFLSVTVYFSVTLLKNYEWILTKFVAWAESVRRFWWQSKSWSVSTKFLQDSLFTIAVLVDSMYNT